MLAENTLISKTLRINDLLDFYADLLTEKQRTTLSLFYEEDFSLGEIGEKAGISRQAVYDSIRRSELLLEEYEAALGLIEAYSKRVELVEALEIISRQLEKNPTQALWSSFWEKLQQLKEGE